MALDPSKSKDGKVKLCHPALHPDFTDPLIAVAEVSEEKGYEPLNWLDENSPVTVMYCLNAAQRHLKKVLKGIDINTEEKKLDGTPCKTQPSELACAAYNLLMADMLLKEKGSKVDDRMFSNGRRKKVSGYIAGIPPSVTIDNFDISRMSPIMQMHADPNKQKAEDALNILLAQRLQLGLQGSVGELSHTCNNCRRK